MRIAELSRRSGVSVPTIKFYLREGLLPSGTPTGRNQATYDETHERRLRLVRALVEVGGLSTAALRQVLPAVDAAAVPALLGRVQRPTDDTADPLREWADAAVARLVARLGWQVGAEHPAARSLAQVLVTAARLGDQDLLASVDAYAPVCEDVAVTQVRSLAELPTAAEAVEGMLLGAVLGDAAIAALRRLAQESAARKHFGRAAEAG